MFLAVILFNDSFVIIMSITFTTLIFIEFLNVMQEVTELKRLMWISIVLSLVLYISSIYFFNTFFQITTFDLEFLLKVGLITLASWLPIYVMKKIAELCDPDVVSKVNRSVH